MRGHQVVRRTFFPSILLTDKRSRSIKPSSAVQSFDALCEVQSDKASVEITSPFDGVVKELLVQEGEIAKVGAGLCLIEVEHDDSEPNSTSQPDSEASSPADPERTHVQDPAAVSAPAELGEAPWPGNFVEPPGMTPSTSKKHPLDPTNADANHATSSRSSPSDHVLATPSVRHFARQQGIDLAALAPGSGRDGRVEKKDVEVFVSARDRVAVSSSSEAEQVVRTDDKDVVVDLGRTRYGMWKAMTQVCSLCLVGRFRLVTLFRASRYPDSGTCRLYRRND